jgi:hypothetical protein
MSVFNKYGTISSEGHIDARFTTYDINYQEAYDIYMADKQGDKYNLPATVANQQGRPTLFIDNQPVATLPTTWTQFVNQVKTRGPLQASAHIQWKDDKQQFRAIVAIEEN